jgi:two-component system, NarL family, response regulator DevR
VVHSPIRIVACDDSPDFIELLAHWLEDHDEIELVGTAENEGEAAAVVAAQRPDVIVSDAFVPGGNPEYLRALRAASPESRILLHTGYEPYQLLETVTELADLVVIKAFDETELVEGIRRLASEHG